MSRLGVVVEVGGGLWWGEVGSYGGAVVEQEVRERSEGARLFWECYMPSCGMTRWGWKDMCNVWDITAGERWSGGVWEKIVRAFRSWFEELRSCGHGRWCGSSVGKPRRYDI